MIITFIYFALVLTIVISIHEFGHFIFAKKAGIYVYEFSIGMGPRLFKFKRKNDETEYSIRLLPIGGYVQMAGESIEVDEKIPKDKQMQAKSWIQKVLVVIAGILFNFILSIVIFFIIGLVTNSKISTTYVTDIKEDTPAYKAGLVDDDHIVSLNGKKINSSDRLQLEMQVIAGESIKLGVVDKNGNNKTITITPDEIEDEKGNKIFKYGFGLKVKSEKGIIGAIKYAFNTFICLISQMFLIIWYLITKKISLSNLSGPIGIFTVVEESAKLGFINIIYLIGYLSLNVGVMNLLPIPALDGGRLFFLLIEKIKGSPLNPKVENTINTVGFILLMILIVVISCNDVIRIIK